jgi:GDP-D-mannose dehydratase
LYTDNFKQLLNITEEEAKAHPFLMVYISEFINLLTNLLKNDHKIFGVTHKNSLSEKILAFENKNEIKIESLDLKDYDVCEDLIKRILPDVIVNFAGLTNIFSPWDDQIKLVDQNIKIPLNLLNVIKKVDDKIFFFQASSSLMFGQSKETKITELSELSPIYPYGLSKSFIHGLMNEYRENLNLNNTSIKLAQAMDKFLERNSYEIPKIITF